eukprot:3957769-Pyramimonas_sp.AAC.1
MYKVYATCMGNVRLARWLVRGASCTELEPTRFIDRELKSNANGYAYKGAIHDICVPFALLFDGDKLRQQAGIVI